MATAGAGGSGAAIASIHDKRDEFRRELQQAAGQAGRRRHGALTEAKEVAVFCNPLSAQKHQN
jgi:hypothetical protein